MATGHTDGSALGIHLDCVQEKGVKESETDPAGKGGLVTQAGSIKGFWERTAREDVKEEPNEGLAQSWEAQWQQFLRVVETPRSEGECFGQQDPVVCSQLPLDICQQLIGDEGPQLLFGCLKEDQPPGDDLVAKHKEACKKIKDEFPDEEGYDEVILGEDAVGWDAERQKFRKFGYQEAKGPREAHGALQDLGRRWLKPERCTKEQILELVILEQFLAILPPEMQDWVKQRRPDSCLRAVALAEVFLLIQKQKVPGSVHKEAANSPNTREPPLDSDEWPLFREIKEEDDRDPATQSGDEEMCGEEDHQGGSSGEAEPLWRLSREAQPSNCVKSRDTFEGVPQKHEGGSVDSQECNRGLDEEMDQPRILTVELEQKRIWCGEVFQCQPTFNDHQQSCVESYESLDCTESFNGSNTFMASQRVHALEEPYICAVCGKSFNEHTVLAAHESSHSAQTLFRPMDAGSLLIKAQIVSPRERPYKCSNCAKSFGTRAILICHKRTHTGEKPYRCPECGKCFSMASALIRHKRTHTGERPHQCLECGRCFGDRSGFNTHMRTHTGEKLYPCPDCGKSFGRQAHLVDHERTHTGEKPYQCQACEKHFSTLSILIKHRRIHTGEKPYSCSFCAKSFSQSSSCMKHERTHTGEKPYKCLHCGQSFSQNSSCVRHERTHAGERSFK